MLYINGQTELENLPPSLTATLLGAVAEYSQDGIVALDIHREAILMNERFTQLWSLTPELIEYGSGDARRAHIFDQVDDPEKLMRMHSLMLDTPSQLSSGVVRLKTGHVLSGISRPIFDEHGSFVAQLIIYRDRTAFSEAVQKRDFLELHDRTTGLLNRTAMFETIDHRAAADHQEAPFALIAIDIAQFSRINEQYGHAFGDRVLVRCAETIRQVVGSRHQVGRHGAAEYMILVEHAAEHHVEDLAQQIIDALSSEMIIDQVPLSLGSTGGISFFPSDGESANDLVSCALLALQRAKTNTPGRAPRYSQEYGRVEQERRELERQLSQAVDGSGLELLYQPIYDLRTQSLSSCEALLRWRSQASGLVSPDIFLPYAEESGLIIPIGEWVLRHACTQAAAWSTETFGAIPISVNVSAKQIGCPGFASMVADILDETDCSPFLLKLELTETSLVSNLAQVSRTIDAVRRLGVKISIDDFGTGYSSLSYLKHFNVDTLKIDKSFTLGIGQSLQDDALIQAMISMAHDLGLIALAEGVETKEQFSFLLNSGCDQVQGFYMNRPMNAAQLTAMLSTGDTWRFTT